MSSDECKAAPPGGAVRPLADAYDAALLDLDGVVYLDGQPIPSARGALAEAGERGLRFAYVTNNASRTPARVAQQLRDMDIAAAATEVVTSAQAAARLVAERVPAGSAVLAVGATGLRHALREQGLRLVTSARDKPAAVVQGYHPAMTYDLLAEGALAVRQGALYVAPNVDTTMPSPRGPLPGNGSLVQVIAAATGQQPLVAGKPELPLHQEALRRTGAQRPLVVGDRLDTDVAGAVRAGTPSLLVLSGIAEPIDVVTAAPVARPTYIARDLGGLLVTHPQPRAGRDGWWCRGWHARNSAGRLSLERASAEVDDPLDGVRALCAAAWDAEEPLDRAALAETLRAVR